MSGTFTKKNGCGKCSSRDSHYIQGEFVFFNKKRDNKETREYKSIHGETISELDTYKKGSEEFMASKNDNVVYKNVYKEVKDKITVKSIIFDSGKGRLNNVEELGGLL